MSYVFDNRWNDGFSKTSVFSKEYTFGLFLHAAFADSTVASNWVPASEEKTTLKALPLITPFKSAIVGGGVVLQLYAEEDRASK